MKILLIILMVVTIGFSKIEEIKNLELLNSMYQTSLFANDLKTAYKIAKVAIKKSNKRIWKRRLAQVAIWLNKYEEAYKILKRLYQQNRNDKKIEKKYLEVSSLLKDYDATIEVLKSRSLRYQNEKDVDNLIYYYNLSGKPMEVAKILVDVYKKSNNPNFLTKAAQLYYNHSNIDLAKKMLLKRKREHSLDLNSAKMLSLCYFDERDVEGALDALLNYNGEKDLEYWKLLSDYSWYLQKFDISQRATDKIMESDNFREVDAERYLLLNRDISEKSFFRIWKRYKNSELLYTYIDNLSKEKRDKQIIEFVKKLDKKYQNRDKVILMTLISSYIRLKENGKVKRLLHKLISLEPKNPSLWLHKIWIDMDLKDFGEVKKDLDDLKSLHNNSPEYYMALASGYMMLQQIDRAYYYLSKIRSGEFNPDIEFFYLNILSYNGGEEHIDKVQRRIWRELNRKKNLNNRNLILNYLQLAIEFLQPPKIEKLFAKYKSKLSSDDYYIMRYIYHTKIDNYDASREDLEKIKNPEAWIELNLAIRENNIMKSQKLLDRKLPLLPYRDAISEARKGNQRALAIYLAFNNANLSQKDYLVDRQFRELMLENANFYQLMSYYKISDNIKTTSFELFNRYYLGDKIFFTQRVKENKFSNQKKTIFKKRPNNQTLVTFGLKELFDRGFISLNLGYREGLKSYLMAEALFNRQLNDKASIEFAISKNEESNQNEILTIGGKQDSLMATLNYQFLDSLQWVNSLKYMKISSQDDKSIANGVTFHSAFIQLVREVYPRMQFDYFVDYSLFNRNGKENGVINQILIEENSNLTPANICSAGFSVRVGNPLLASKKIRAYGALTTSINCNGTLNYLGELGLTKQLFNDDFLNLYYLYEKNSKTEEKNSKMKLDYKMLY